MSPKKEKKKADKTILALTNFSKGSTNAILFAARLFKDSHLNCQLVNIFENPNEKASLLISVEDILSKDSEVGLKNQAAEITSALKRFDITISTFSVSGKFKKVIGSLAQNENIDMIVAGISQHKYLFKELNSTPILFMGENRVPVLLVPENCSCKTSDSIVIMNLGADLRTKKIENGFEHIVNHDHISKHVITLNERKIDNSEITSLLDLLKKNECSILVIIPQTGDRIDRALLDYQIQELLHQVTSLLNC